MNPLYQQLMNPSGMTPNTGYSGGMQFQNPIQKMQYIMHAMTNPAAFVRQAIPDLPSDISNDPNRILQYLQQTRGITNAQIRQAASMIPR